MFTIAMLLTLCLSMNTETHTRPHRYTYTHTHTQTNRVCPGLCLGQSHLTAYLASYIEKGAEKTKSNQSWVCVSSCWADSARVWVWVYTIVATHSHSYARQIHYNFALPFSPLSISLPFTFPVPSLWLRDPCVLRHTPQRISSLHFLWSHCWCFCYCWHAYTPHTHTGTHIHSQYSQTLSHWHRSKMKSV